MAQILDSATAQKLESVAFPLIGCGRFGLDEKMLILQFLDAIEEFDDRLPESESFQVWLVIRDRAQFESAAGTFLDLLMQARSKLVSIRVKRSGVSILDRFASRLLERTNEEWGKWQLCRYAEVATEVMCYGISRATNPATTPEALFEEGPPATFGHFLEKAKHLLDTAELDGSAWGVRFFSRILKETSSERALDAINQQRNDLAHGRRSLPLAKIKRLVAQGLNLELWERITEIDGEVRLADWRPWVGMPSGTDRIGLFERWQKNSLRYLVPETGEVFNVPRQAVSWRGRSNHPLAIRRCLGYTKHYEKSIENRRRRSRVPPGRNLCPRLLKGAGKGGLLDPSAVEAAEGNAAANGFAVAQEYVDVETAKQTGRAAFGEMVGYLKAHPSIRVMLVEKTDRLYRNLKDWVTVDELDVEMHFPKEGVVLSRESRSSEKFMHGIKVLMAKNYIDNLSEEARKGMQEKAEQGIWPTKTPLGYRNIIGPDGKKIIAADPAIAPLIIKLFEWYGRGDISLKEAARKAHAAGLLYPKSGAKVPVSTVHTILRNRLYTGWFEWNGKLIPGKHEALVPVALWERVQGVLDGRFVKKAKRGKHDFAFSGLIACSRCGCAVVGEIKKQRYVYYHCTGYADKCQGNPASCRRKHVREEAIEAQFTELLGRLRFDDEVLEWVREALHASHADERRDHEEAIRRHQAEYKRLDERIHAMYVDKLDGLVDAAFFERMSNQWREEQNRCLREIERHQDADKSYLEEGVALLELARNAQRLFAKQEPREKRRLLNFVLSNCTWEDGEVVATFREPFDMLAETATAAARIGISQSAKMAKSEIWLGD